VLESEHQRHPQRAAVALQAEAFTAQLLESLDARRGDEIVSDPAVDGRDDLYVHAAAGGKQGRGAARRGDLDVPRAHARQQHRRLADKNDLRVGAVLGEKLLFLSRPEDNRPRIHAGVGDDDFR